MEVLVEEFEGLKSIAARLDDPRTQINIFRRGSKQAVFG